MNLLNYFINESYTIKDNWLPDTSEGSFNSTFSSYKVGAMISYSITTYTASDSYNVNKLILPPLASVFNPPSNIETLAAGWVTSLLNTGKVDYFIFTTGHQIGFSIYDTQVELETQAITDAQFGSINIPIRANYKHTTYDIMNAMVGTARAANKPIWLYMNIGRRVNDRGSNNYGDSDKYLTYITNKLLELIDLYNPDGFWLDAPNEPPWNTNELSGERLNQLYTDLKNKKNDIKITLNYFYTGTLYSGGNLRIFPSDIISLERGAGRVLTDTSEYNYPKTNQVNSYYINSEDLTHNNDEIIFFGADNKGATPSSQAQIQALYDASKAVGVPIGINISPSQDGTLAQYQIDYFSNLNL